MTSRTGSEPRRPATAGLRASRGASMGPAIGALIAIITVVAAAAAIPSPASGPGNSSMRGPSYTAAPLEVPLWSSSGTGANSTTSLANASDGNLSLTPDVTCHPLPDTVCVYVVLPQNAGGTYLAYVDYGGVDVTSSQAVVVGTGSPTSISVYWYSPGAAFSFWGSSSGLTLAQFESSSTTATATTQSDLYLNVYETAEAASVTFDTDPSVTGLDAGQITLGGHTFLDGQSITLTNGESYGVGATASSPWFFWRWTGISTGFSSESSSQTTVTLTSTASTIIEVLNITSSNWAGYAAYESTDFTTVQGSWVVPTLTCEVHVAFAAFIWAGIDGFLGSTVEQIGVAAQCSISGAPSYQVFYEMYPASAQYPTSAPVITAGDKISASVAYSETAQDFALSLKDVSTGGSYSTTQPYSNQALASAECISEHAPYNGSGNHPGWSSVSFGSASTGVPNTCDAGIEGQTPEALAFLQPVSILLASSTGTYVSYNTALDQGSFAITYT
jgi:hypothetical protein